jgi:hypothetical protein
MVKASKPNGYTLVEVSIALGLGALITVGATKLVGDLILQSRKASVATEVSIGLDLGAKWLEDDLSRAGINLNTTDIPDVSSKNFFQYFPYAPKAGTTTNEERKIILSLNKTKYPKSVDEFIFLVTDINWTVPLIFSPRKAYLTGRSCSEGNSLTFNINCFFDNNIVVEAEREFGADIMKKTSDSMFFFQIPQYFRPLAKANELLSYAFLAPSTFGSSKVVDAAPILKNNTVSSSLSQWQSNRYTSINYMHPNGTTLQNLDQFLKKIPFYAGGGTSFNLSRVRLVKYLIEYKKIDGIQTSALYRIELERVAADKFKRLQTELVSDGFEALFLTRKMTSDPIVNVSFERQFRLNDAR